jgi:hypothetical protein
VALKSPGQPLSPGKPGLFYFGLPPGKKNDFLVPALLDFERQASQERAALQCTAALAARAIYGAHDGR